MKYIAHRRFKGRAACGDVNIPAMTELYLKDNVIYYEEYPICYFSSENAKQYFTVNEDGQGMLRGKYTQAIQKKLAIRDENYQNRWNKIWEDNLCVKKYKRKDSGENYFLWDTAFFNAPILDLQHIASLIDVKV